MTERSVSNRPRWSLLLVGVLIAGLGLVALAIQLWRMATGEASYERSAVTVVGASMFLTVGGMVLWLALRRR
ncbi:MAG: hypothetical protein PF961_22915 [Planctomycetota bacterium]|jgi:hypothetical protein|nr:hypothetical protein [Planctomycetota bacterium]